VKQILIAILSLTITLMLVWMAPALGPGHSACERYPLTSGCR
jgi:hypothetical protein